MEDLNPFYADALWLSIAFLFGLIAKRIGLPPLVGFLAGGFLINFLNLHDANLESAIAPMADIGVMLLLFTIGLKLKVKSLFKKEILLSASLHMTLTVVVLSSLLALLSFSALHLFADLPLHSSVVIAFALSFSSTVFVVKTLEARGEFDSYHGKLAIGILIIQDIFAVLFLALSDKKIPSLWVLLLPVILWVLQKLLSKLLDLLEHGEMVPVFGFFATFIAGAFSFSLLGLKPDLGALIMGMLLVNHPRVNELYDRMAEYKDFFLIAFFINVGLVGLPTLATMSTALILLPLIIFKGVLFLFLLSRFNLQPRTAYLGALSLSNFSEFGLIVGVVGLNMGWITEEWLVALALLMSLSFVVAAPLNLYSHRIFNHFKDFILRINNVKDTEDAEPVDFGGASYLVIGLGSVGKPAFLTLQERFGEKVLGLDYDSDKIKTLKNNGANVTWGDPTDCTLWDAVDAKSLDAIFLTMSDVSTNLNILSALQSVQNRSFNVYALCHYPDQKAIYLQNGVDFVFDFKSYLGKNFVEHALENRQLSLL
ncbi:MAG: cation:proton antiporter [Schleiferiaceae bacterium]|nr:cation:proton antiporter [Schleiferiaceae bacterium]